MVRCFECYGEKVILVLLENEIVFYMYSTGQQNNFDYYHCKKLIILYS